MEIKDDNPESRLLYLAMQGDKNAFGSLYMHYLDEIYRFVYLKIGDKLVAEDITEDTFAKTWESLPRIYKKKETIHNLRSWLYRIANNLVIDFYRKRKPIENIDFVKPENAPMLEESLVENELSDQLARAIRKLSSDFQQIIILRIVNELSHKEIAPIMNISEGYSRVLLYRALKKLKRILQKGRDA